MLRLVLLALATWVAGDIGFATFRPEYGAAMIWPLTGVALVWAGTGSRRTWPLDAAVFTVVNTGALLAADATWGQAVMGGLQALVQVAVYLALLRRLAPHLWSAGGDRPLVRLADLGAFTLAVAVGALAAALVRAAGLGLIPVPHPSETGLAWVRNFCGMFTIGTVALMAAPLLRAGRGVAGLRAEAREWWGHWPARTPEAVLVSLVSLGGYVAVFAIDSPLPVSFLLMLPVLWAGLRMSPVVAATLALVLGVLALVLTLEDHGIFAAVADPLLGALLAQAFVVATLGFAVAIALVSGERLRATAQALRVEARAEERAVGLARFAGVVAHDLSTPLTVVGGWADALADAFADGDVDGATGSLMSARIQDASAQMRAFVDDLLAYTVARDRPLTLRPVDLSALAEDVARLRRASAREPEITVQPGLRAQGDEVLLRQLLDNLVGNAVKYVPAERRPRVHVEGRQVGSDVEVAVVDNGIGVPPQERERIFESFVRATGSEAFSGTGLGLDICRQVVERHGGSLRVEDGPGGQGSRFVLALPAAEEPQTQTQPQTQPESLAVRTTQEPPV